MKNNNDPVRSLNPGRGFRVRLGFVPLLDSAPLIIARELDLFREEGLDVVLTREASWATLRDKVAFGLLDGAHMLAPMPIAMSMAGDRPRLLIVSAMVLSRNGNGITVSGEFHKALVSEGGHDDSPVSTARALLRVARRRGHPVRLASVAPWSSHDLQLRDWVNSAGPEARDYITITPVSPVQMQDAFRSGSIEGCCVGEPWNSLLEQENLGIILHSGHQIWQNAPEKVLGMRADWAEQNPFMHQRLIRALMRACRWLDDSAHHRGLREILADSRYLGEQLRNLNDRPFSLFHPRLQQHFFQDNANFPWLSQAHWIASRLIHWHHMEAINTREIRNVVRPDIYREAAASLGVDAPRVDTKIEGQHTVSRVVDGQQGPVSIAGDALIGQQIHSWPESLA